MTNADETSAPTRKLQCPKCAAPMDVIHFHNIQVDRCTGCKGLWFDALEREHLDAMRNSQSIDIGAASREDRSAVVRINCPVCHTLMIRMVEHHHPHIWFEACKVCFGLFYDAGEFRDHKEQTILSFFRDLFSRERK